MRNINKTLAGNNAFHPFSGVNACEGGGGVDSGKTSSCGELPAATGCGVLRRKKGHGAPLGNRRALKHGAYTAEKLALKRQINAFIRHARDIAEAVEVQLGYKPRRRRRKAAPA
jgi:hypothetical protein